MTTATTPPRTRDHVCPSLPPGRTVIAFCSVACLCYVDVKNWQAGTTKPLAAAAEPWTKGAR